MKKHLIVGFFVCIAIIVIGGVIWCGKDMENEKQQVSQQQQEQASITTNETKREGKKVWYYVPEIGIRFQVTSDMRDDLKYSVAYSEEHRKFTVYFYLQSIVDFNEKYGVPCAFYKEEGDLVGITPTCSDFALKRININDIRFGRDNWLFNCEGGSEKVRTNEYLICYTHSQAVSLMGDRSKYEEMRKDKIFEIFWDTTETLLKE